MLAHLDVLSLNTQVLFNLIVILSVCCALGILVVWKKVNEVERVFGYYIVAIGFFELIAWLGPRYLNQSNNLPGLHIYTLVQFVLMALFFQACFKEFSAKFNIKWITRIGIVLIVFNSLFIQSIYTYNSYSKTLVEFFVIVSSLILFSLFIKDKTHNQKQMKPSVSFVSAIFLQSSVAIIIYMYSNEIMYMKESLRNTIWHLKLMVNYLAVAMIILGLIQIYFRESMIVSEAFISKEQDEVDLKVKKKVEVKKSKSKAEKSLMYE